METVWVLGDQINRNIASLSDADPRTTRILMVVSRRTLASRRWHRQRLHLVLSAMCHFADDLRAEGFQVDWREADTFAAGLAEHRAQYHPNRIVAMSPMSWSGRSMLERNGVEIVDNDQFLCSPAQFAAWAATRKGRLRMEDFYRWQRQRLDLLMDGDQPTGGRWNYDDQNRLPPPKDGRPWPEPARAPLDGIDEEVRALIDRLVPQAFGEPHDGLWPTTRQQALERLHHAVHDALPLFGPHEDAMLTGNWHLAHTAISSALNIGLLHPMDVAEAAERAYRDGHVPLASAEGFVRQIIGWREYVWGVYWLWMPDYSTVNELGAHRPLPPVFVDAGTTRMRCVATAVQGIDQRAYLHHIQRLMVLGNLALISGVDPQAMAAWMREAFIDGADWVMLPNVLGMALHADGGRMATKPYAGGGAYISKMSDHCKGCAYDPKRRTGPTACPFTTLYWDFLARHEARFRPNHRMANQLAGLKRLSDLPDVRSRAQEVLAMLDAGTL